MTTVRCLLLLLAVSIAAQSAPSRSEDLGAGLDQWMAETMKEWKVPGVALAVVKDGQVILSKGYGYRDVARQLPVTPKTLMAIGSSSKAFTVMSLGVLVDDGKLDWDKPVREYLPNFRMHDPFAGERMTPRDLVTHRSGLPRHDALWYNSPLSRKEMFERLRHLEPNKDFRSTFQYQNLMFMTAGYLAGEVAGTTWEKLVKERIFNALEMKSSNFSVNDSQKSVDFALPYRKEKEEVKVIPFRVIDEVGPAGSINSNIEDMANYLRMNLNGGKHGSRQVLSANNVTQMQSPQMVIPGPLLWKEVGHSGYGMGWMITTYRGQKLVHHGGNIDGFSAMVTFMPRENIGMVILTNLNGTPLPTVVSYNVYDRLLGLEQVAWTQRLKENEKKQQEAEEEARKKGFTTRQSGTQPSHALASFAGDYQHPGYGVMNVLVVDGRLKISFNRMNVALEHFHYDTFEAVEDPGNPLQKSKITFANNVKGDVESLAIALEPNVKEIVFARLAGREMSQRSFLEPLTGQYQMGAQVVAISLQGENKLVASIAGQPPYDLIPSRGTTFELKGITGFSIEFRKDPAGQVNEIAVFQPNGVFVGKRK